MSADDLYKSVPLLDGSNYQVWAQGMTAVLRAKGVWQVVRGKEVKPPVLSLHTVGVDQDDVDERVKERLAWDNKDDMALGLMQLKMVNSLHSHITETIASETLWEELKNAYGISGPAKVFADFRKVISFKISGNGHPTPELLKLQNTIDQLRLDKVILDDFMQAMILLSAIPVKWDNVPATILATKKRTELTFNLVRDALVTEYERKTTSSNPSSSKKISNVKRKGSEPQYRPTQQQPNQPVPSKGQGGEQQQRKKTRRGKSSKDKGKGRTKEDNYISFMGPVIEIPDTPPPSSSEVRESKKSDYDKDFPPLQSSSLTPPCQITTINGRGIVELTPIAPINRKKVTPTVSPIGKLSIVDKTTPASKYIVGDKLTPPPNLYPDVQAARKLADKIGVRKTIATLSQLESSSTKRKAIDYPLGESSRKRSSSPKKSDDEISLDWGSDLDAEIGATAGLPAKTCKSDILTLKETTNQLQQPYQRLEVNSWVLSAVPLSLPPLWGYNNHTIVTAASDLRGINERFKEHMKVCPTCRHKHHDSEEWIMDSGASIHFTGYKSDFSGIQYGDFGDSETANGITKVTAKGTVFIEHTIELEDGTEYNRVSKLYPVFYMPRLSMRLLSMGTLLQENLEIIGSSSRMIFKNMRTDKVEMTCSPHHHGQTIYWVKSKILKPVGLTASVKYEELHRRMGHPSDEVLRHVPGHTKGFDKLIIPKEHPICPGCAQGKMHSKSFPESSSRATKKFQIIHSDLKEFPVSSYHHFKYYMSFIDDYSSFSWVTKLRNKSDAYDAFLKWIALVKNQYEDKCSIKTWHCDGGGEYITDKFIEKLEKMGINLVRSAPHTPQQHGRAERFNRTTMDKAESLRHQAGLPSSWWEFAVDHAVYVYNRTPMRRLQWQTPYELIHGEKPDISHIRVLGCGAYVWLPEAKRQNKLSPKSELMIYLGDATGIKGYKFMRTQNNIIFIGTTAQFIEDYFPRKEKQYRGDPGQPLEETGNDKGQPDSPHLPNKEDDDEHDDNHSSHQPASSPPEQDQQRVRRSTRERRNVYKPDNVYGDRNPTDIDRNADKDRFWKEVIEPGQDSNQNGSPDPSAGNNRDSGLNPAPDNHSDDQSQHEDISDDDLNRIVREGGEELVNLLLMRASTHNIPQQFRDILKLPQEQRDEWINACKEEIEALRKRQVFDLVDLPKGKKPISNRWVFDIKADSRKRARLVAKGFEQKEGIDYDAIFSPVVRYETVRLMLALGALENWHFEALDVKTAFLYGRLDKEVYMRQPEGFVIRGKKDKVFRLKKAIYGLKQASHSWWEELKNSMSQFSFQYT